MSYDDWKTHNPDDEGRGMTDYIRSYADISPCGKYRYLLEREWRGTHAHKNWHWMG